MKKILYSLLIATLALTFGCEEPDEVKYTVADGFQAIPSPFTHLDNEATINFSTANPEVSELTIKHIRTIHRRWDSEKGAYYLDTTATELEGFGSISISEGTGSMTITRSDVKVEDDVIAGSKVEFSSKADIKGEPKHTFSISVGSAFNNVTDPYIWVKNKEGDLVTKNVSVLHNDNIQYIKYDIVRNAKSVNLILEEKINYDGTYTERTDVDLNTDANDKGHIIDSIEVKGTDYNYGDTVYYRFTASSTFNSEQYSMKVPINKLTFSKSGTFKLDSTANQAWDMVNNKMIMDTANYDSADVALTYSAPDMGLTSSDSTSFIDATSIADLKDPENKEQVVSVYKDNTGSETNTVNNLEVGDIILTKTFRNNDENYGVLIVKEAWVNTSENNYFLTLEYHNN